MSPKRSDSAESNSKSSFNVPKGQPVSTDEDTSTWIETQNRFSANLLPLISQQDGLYSLLDGGDAKCKEELVVTCHQIFRHIEYLAELQDRLKREEIRNSNGECSYGLAFTALEYFGILLENKSVSRLRANSYLTRNTSYQTMKKTPPL